MGRRYKPAGTPSTPDTNQLWTTIINHQNTLFHTAKGLPFTYIVTQLPDGTPGNEILFSRKAKTITRSTVNIAYQRVKEIQGEIIGEGMEDDGQEDELQRKEHRTGHGVVTGPKQLGVFGASYIYAVFRGIGVIRDEEGEETGGETCDGGELLQ